MNMTLRMISDDCQTDSRTEKEIVFNQLMSLRGGYQNDFYLARILSSWLNGEGVLPGYVGLSSVDYFRMVARHFSGLEMLVGKPQQAKLDSDRIPEWEDLHNLLLEYRAGSDRSEELVAQIIATACMGLDHLWQDLGFWSRQELTEVMRLNFPKLAERNNKNMKWKKFLYKQLCERDDTFVCRAPSCDVCADYQQCFGPEE
jgi:nitrogen fixation protein NifQ